MKVQFSIKAVLLLTVVVTVLAAICAAVPATELRDLGLPLKSLYARQPTLKEVAIRLAWSAPLVLLFVFFSVRQWKLTHRK